MFVSIVLNAQLLQKNIFSYTLVKKYVDLDILEKHDIETKFYKISRDYNFLR